MKPATAARIAIIGSGPAGVYAAGHLFNQFEHNIQVDMFERLPTPWGLVRGGVAPDHPEKKLITRSFERIACNPAFRFFGNVEVGRDIGLVELRKRYDAVILAYGAPRHRSAGIPGEALSGCASAADFVGWYNGHPDYSDLEFQFKSEHAIVVGNGNVALDIARILTLPVEELRRTDIANHALLALENSPIRHVTILGRRGALQASFNNPELHELGHIPGVDVSVRVEDLPTNIEIEVANPDWATRRKLSTLVGYSQRSRQNEKCIELRFLCTPHAVVGDDHCTGLEYIRNEPAIDDGVIKFVSTGSTQAIPGGNIFFAVGFQGYALQGIPFDTARHIVPNLAGRVVGVDMHGVYVCGWIARGPSGVIGTNKVCAQRAVEALLSDLQNNRISIAGRSVDPIEDYLRERSVDPVSYSEWQNIDDIERGVGTGASHGRTKITSWKELIYAAHSVAA